MMKPDDANTSARMTKDDLPDGRGYRVMFSGLEAVKSKQPAWPLDPFDPNYLSSIASMTQNHLEVPVTQEENPFVYASKEGLELLESAGMEWVRDLFYNPTKVWGEAKTGERPLIQKATVAGKECTLRHLSWAQVKEQETEQESSGHRLSNISEPDYLQRFGLTTRVASTLRGAADRISTFQVQEPLVEYIASRNFKVDEYRPGIYLHDLRRLVHIPEEPDEKYLGQTKRWWEHWFEKFELEIARLKDIFFIVGYEKGEPFSLASFAPQNWVCNGFDPATGTPLLALVNQEAGPIGGMGSVLDTGDTTRASQYQDLTQRYAQDVLLIKLRG